MAVFEFGCFSLNVTERSLVRRGRPLRVSQRLFDILTLLVENNQRVVTKTELIDAIWSETIVEDSNLTVAISRIRTLLGDVKHRRRYIVTLPRSGYRFVGDVRRVGKSDSNSVAVLPFEYDDTHPDSKGMADSLTESLIYALSTLTRFKVIPRSSVIRYKRKQIDPAKVATALGVTSLINGRLLQHQGTIGISIELLKAGGKELVWGKQYHHAQGLHWLTAQTDIVRTIVEDLPFESSSETQERTAKRVSTDQEACKLYLRGRFHWSKRSEVHLQKSIEYFKQAIKAQPAYALSYAGLADSYNMLGFYSMMAPKIAFTRAKAASVRALAIEHSIAEAHASFGFATFYRDWDWHRAEKAFKQALHYNENCLEARLYYGCLLVGAGRFDEAIQQYERALEVDPLSIIANAALGYGYYFARRYDEAIAQCKAACELDEHFEAAHVWLGWAYQQTGRFTEAIIEYEKAIGLSGRQTSILATIGLALARAGRKDEARQTLQELANRGQREFVSQYHVACIYGALDDREKAFQCLELTYRDRSHLLTNLRVDPKLDPLRSDPRFAEFAVRIHRMNAFTSRSPL